MADRACISYIERIGYLLDLKRENMQLDIEKERSNISIYLKNKIFIYG